ncbi:FAD:protein FMN transferase [Isoalcanivorax indicus]|uniref:FAD:protein FMN transferase n=1 Tax=Isoalcanivorax indicus TaxID=2202653 RepID=UPI001FE5307C|nr:FAD:protein FMN transferase [Isoalcanivorax indicus]
MADGMPMMHRSIATQGLRALLLFALLLILQGCDRAERIERIGGPTMGTVWQVQMAGLPAGSSVEQIQDDLEALLALVNRQMSTYIEDSDLSRFNQAEADTWQRIPPDFARVLASALRMADISDGAFDPTVGPLVNLWGFGPDGRRREPPAADVLAETRARVGWQQLETRDDGREIRQPGGLYLDLSAIAKGYAVDRLGEYLDARGVQAWLVDIGGDMRARGVKPDGSAWRVGVERPSSGARQIHSVVEPGDMAMATSGDYRNYFRDGGRQFSHTIDPRTAEPVDHQLASVTVIHPSCMEADGYATLITVLGHEEGLAFARERDLAVLLISRDGDGFREDMTEAFSAYLVQ